ncbi:dihydrodipicolinate synthase family protein [Pseudactinotalea sp. HY158]|uniref:dihydrodipicolinate synthase family protein n=1 Tax=Pseudactinotalea sp. HY158 TaxID=2654547 RepID=UPI001891F36B|nr:dihydrodipicolinate synthase family protein [Pseudactinotalea sp. HY158]
MNPHVITAMPVPFTTTGALDLPAYRRAVTAVDPHVDGVLVAGTTGEFPALDDDERLELFAATRDLIGPERTIAHLGHASTRQVIRLARATVDLGLRRSALITPYYLPTDPAGVVDFYREVLDAVPGLELFVYLFPERTGLDVSPSVLTEILALPGIVGVKLSGAASETVADYAGVLRSGQLLYSGNDATLPDVMAAGGHGVVSGVSSLFPTVFAALSAALCEGRGHDRIQSQAAELVALTGANIRFLKAGLAARDGGDWASRMSLPTPNSETVNQIHDAVASFT